MQIIFSTPHGEFKISKWNFDQTIKELCVQNKIPFQSMSFFGKKEDQFSPIIGLHRTIGSLVSSFDTIFIKADRNIDYNRTINKNIKIKSSLLPVSEYTFPSEDSEELHHFEFSQSDCQKFVIKKVISFLKNDVVIHPTAKIVFGISGGGDSNTLLMSFLESGLVQREQLIAVMMLGIPDWDKGKTRAEAICKNHGVELRYIEAEKVNELLGKPQKSDWVEDFEKVFPNTDLEVLGTHCIRLALEYVAEKTSAQAVVTGLNLEDILAECFLAVMRGKLPPPFPVRKIDGLDFWHPLYNIPKKIIDGCYPKYSLENYNDRYPSHMLGRAIAYYLSQSMHGCLPGIEFDLLSGFKELAKLHDTYGVFDNELGFSTVESVSRDMKSKWQQFIECP